MTRKECLDKAAECVLKDRQNVYGKPEDCFSMIARMWGAYLGVCISAHDVAAMMALLKIARFRHNPLHEDNAVDCAGYAACMAETATAWEQEGEDEDEDVKNADAVVLWKHKPKAEAEGCEALVEHDAPQTPAELYDRILSVNPATFHTPSYAEEQLEHRSRLQAHKPTGEELAEMAEEAEHE